MPHETRRPIGFSPFCCAGTFGLAVDVGRDLLYVGVRPSDTQIMVFNGAEDPFVKPEQIEAFKAEMEAAGVKYSFTNYEGVKHSFTNPDADEFGRKFGLPLEYNADADEASWGAFNKALKATYGR